MKKNEKKTDVIVKVFDVDGAEKLSVRCRNWLIVESVVRGEHGKPDKQTCYMTADGPFEPYVSRC